MEKLQRFLELRPAIRLHYAQSNSFFDYVRRFKGRVQIGQGKRLIATIIEWAQIQPMLDIDIKLLRAQLEYFPLLSSADHGGILDNSILVNANLLYSGFMDMMALPYQIVFATMRIPLDNASNPRGIYFQGQKRPFFQNSLKHMPIWLLQEGLNGQSLGTLFRESALKDLKRPELEFLENLFFNELDLKKITSIRQKFDEQIPLINHKLWSLYFAKELRQSIAKMLYIPSEFIVNSLVIADLKDESSWFYKILFDPEVRTVYLEEFMGIAGCWTPHSGTHFFWAADQNKGLIPLHLDQDCQYLVPKKIESQCQPIPFNAISIIQGIESRRLMPSLFTEMFLLTFIEGFTLLGGFNQITYLAWMRVAHEKSMLRLRDWPQAAQYARTVTDGLICGPLPFPEYKSGMDLLWQANAIAGNQRKSSFDKGISQKDISAMMSKSLASLISNGIDAMMDVLE